MPDWVGHLFAGAATGRMLRVRNLHIVLLGTLLPDVNAVLGTLSDLGHLPVHPYGLVLFLIPMSSPFAYLCLCAAAAAWFTQPVRAFGLLALGAGTHVLLDMLQVGHVELPGYPLFLAVVNWPIHNYGENGDYWISGTALVALLLLRLLPLHRDISLSFRRGWMCVLPLLLLAAVIWLNTPRLEASNVLNLRFFRGETVPDNDPVALISSRVTRTDPLLIAKAGREVAVKWVHPIPQGRLVSVWGRWHGGQVVADRVVIHAPFQKILFSILGVVVFLLYWIDLPWKRSSQEQPRPA